MRRHCSELCLEVLFSPPSRIRGSGIRIARGGSSNFFSVCLFRCFTFLSCWETGEFGVSGIYRKGPIKPTPPTDGGEMGRKDDPPSHIQQSHPRLNLEQEEKKRKRSIVASETDLLFPCVKQSKILRERNRPKVQNKNPFFSLEPS